MKSVVCGGGAGGAGVCLCWAADRGGGGKEGGWKEGGWRFQCSKVK